MLVLSPQSSVTWAFACRDEVVPWFFFCWFWDCDVKGSSSNTTLLAATEEAGGRKGPAIECRDVCPDETEEEAAAAAVCH